MTEILFNDDEINLILNDGNNDQTNITPVVVVVDEPSTLVRRDSIVIPSISNSSISSVIQIENNNNNNTLLPVCTSNSLGKKISSINFIVFFFFR
jgi:hypothetical protein